MDRGLVFGNNNTSTCISVPNRICTTPCYRVHCTVLYVTIAYFLFLITWERLVFVCLGSSSSSLDSSWFSNISSQVIISLITFLSLNVISKSCSLVGCHVRSHAIVFVDRIDQFLFIAFLITLIWSSHSFCNTFTLGFHRWCDTCAIFMLPDRAVIFSVRFVNIIFIFV